jgi:hypothetical protein
MPGETRGLSMEKMLCKSFMHDIQTDLEEVERLLEENSLTVK